MKDVHAIIWRYSGDICIIQDLSLSKSPSLEKGARLGLHGLKDSLLRSQLTIIFGGQLFT
jgi:hypothetical protein